MQRKTVLLIWGAVIAVLLFTAIVVVSFFAGENKEEPNVQPTPSLIVPPSNDPDDGVSIGNPDNPNAPPEDIYGNDYSQDEGYVPLPQGFVPDASNIIGTTYDEEWALTKYHTLVCELVDKETVTERAIKPLTDFSNDLAGVPYENGPVLRDTIQMYLTDYRNHLGERPPTATRNIMAEYCLYNDVELDDREH